MVYVEGKSGRQLVDAYPQIAVMVNETISKNRPIIEPLFANSLVDGWSVDATTLHIAHLLIYKNASMEYRHVVNTLYAGIIKEMKDEIEKEIKKVETGLIQSGAYRLFERKEIEEQLYKKNRKYFKKEASRRYTLIVEKCLNKVKDEMENEKVVKERAESRNTCIPTAPSTYKG